MDYLNPPQNCGDNRQIKLLLILSNVMLSIKIPREIPTITLQEVIIKEVSKYTVSFTRKDLANILNCDINALRVRIHRYNKERNSAGKDNLDLNKINDLVSFIYMTKYKK